jgi:hypothetical protein
MGQDPGKHLFIKTLIKVSFEIRMNFGFFIVTGALSSARASLEKRNAKTQCENAPQNLNDEIK